MLYEHIFFDLDCTLWDFETNSRDTFAELIDKHNFNEKGIIAHEEFISEYLKGSNAVQSLLAFYQKLHELYPERAEIFLSLIDSLFLNDQRAEALKALGRAKVLEYAGWNDIAERYKKEGEEIYKIAVDSTK